MMKRFLSLLVAMLVLCACLPACAAPRYPERQGGTTDAAALKAAKVTISSVVPVVGSILSDASEAVLVSAGVMKSAAGVYGILAIMALFLEPFLRIGMHYLMMKATAALCAVFGSGGGAGLIEDFSTAMGLLLAMTSATCLLLLISTVCFLKGVG